MICVYLITGDFLISYSVALGDRASHPVNENDKSKNLFNLLLQTSISAQCPSRNFYLYI